MKYEFECKSCGRVEEYSSRDARPHCCGFEMKRCWHAPGVVFKGSGFYTTDSRNKQ